MILFYVNHPVDLPPFSQPAGSVYRKQRAAASVLQAACNGRHLLFLLCTTIVYQGCQIKVQKI
jgi:hypothetical protein